MTLEETFQNAQAAQQAGDSSTAEELFRQIIAEEPDHAHAHRFLAILLFQRGAASDAELHFARAAELIPDEPYVHQNYAMVLNENGRFAEAIAAADRAIARKADYGLAYFNRAAAKLALRRFEEAIQDYRRAAVLGVTDPFLYFSLGYVLAVTGKRDEALAEYGRAIELNPRYIEAIANRGILYKEMGRSHDALAAFDQAILLNPTIAESHNQRGTVLQDLKRLPEALAAYQTALTIKPDYAKAMLNIATLLIALGRYSEAVMACDRAAAIAPELPFLQDARLHAAMHVCDWRDFDARTAALLSQVERGVLAQPYTLLSLPATPKQMRICAENFAADRTPPRRPIYLSPRKPGRLRIAYVGATFRQHPVALLIAGMMANHDRGAFEIFCISHGVPDDSDVRQRIVDGCEHIVEAHGWDDLSIAQYIRDLGIDIAIDLDGYTEDARPAILSYRPAPVQAQFLGYPGTMGAAHIDYLFGDSVVIPPGQFGFYSEKIIRLPYTYQPNSHRPDAPAPSRTDMELPEDGIVFGCFNNAFKITPQLFDSWMRILSRVENSVLWLLVPDPTAQKNLMHAATERGIEASRLVFAPRTDWQSHLARQDLMDIFLDTYFYNAHTTASDALWAGIPLVTTLGQAFPGRVAASLLTTVDAPELITSTPQEYEDLAVALAQDMERRAEIKDRLLASRETSPLFNAADFARHMEVAFRQMWARHESGRPPESFDVLPEFVSA